MTEGPLDIAPPPPARPFDGRRAWRALRSLVAEPDRTDFVFELLQAMGGDAGERLFQRFLRDPDGRALLREQPSLLATLGDRERLAALPEGSLGRSYARFMGAAGIEAAGLVEAAAAVPNEGPVDPHRRWFFDRLRDMHDLWHVLTGYGRDLAGEAALLAFSHAQTRNRGIGAIVLAGAWKGPRTPDLRWQRYLLRAWQRGRRAAPLPMQRWEALLARPLDEVRRELGIEPPEQAHPGGVIVFEGDERATATAA